MKCQKGFTITELLIALIIGSIVLTAVIHHYLNAKKRYGELQFEMDNYVDVLFITELIRDSIRKAGFTPCLSIEHLTTPQLMPGIEVNNNTQFLKINHMSEHFNLVQGIYDLNLKMSNSIVFDENQTLLISDCYHAEILKLNKISIFGNEQWVMLAKPLRYHYLQPVYIGEWLEEKFKLDKTKKTSILYYGVKRLEVLSKEIQTIKYIFKNERLLHGEFTLSNGKHLAIDTRIRSQ